MGQEYSRLGCTHVDRNSAGAYTAIIYQYMPQASRSGPRKIDDQEVLTNFQALSKWQYDLFPRPLCAYVIRSESRLLSYVSIQRNLRTTLRQKISLHQMEPPETKTITNVVMPTGDNIWLVNVQTLNFAPKNNNITRIITLAIPRRKCKKQRVARS